MSTTKLQIKLREDETHNIRLSDPRRLNISMVTPYGSGGGNAIVTVDTTAGWRKKTSYIPKLGEIVVYSDRTVIDDEVYPGVKIGDGLAYAVDLPFLNDDVSNRIIEMIREHIRDASAHLMEGDRERWDNKLDCELLNETLVFYRSDING